MPDEHTLTLRQADLIADQLARMPTRGQLAQAALGIIFCTAVLTTLFVWIAWH
jgi:hypothetical protein